MCNSVCTPVCVYLKLKKTPLRIYVNELYLNETYNKVRTANIFLIEFLEFLFRIV